MSIPRLMRSHPIGISGFFASHIPASALPRSAQMARTEEDLMLRGLRTDQRHLLPPFPPRPAISQPQNPMMGVASSGEEFIPAYASGIHELATSSPLQPSGEQSSFLPEATGAEMQEEAAELGSKFAGEEYLGRS